MLYFSSKGIECLKEKWIEEEVTGHSHSTLQQWLEAFFPLTKTIFMRLDLMMRAWISGVERI